MICERAERNGARIVLDELHELGVEVVFGYPGGAIMPLHDAFFGHSVRHVLVRHEAAAAFAAGGYARATGRVGVCVATSGPGATNLITGIVDAMTDSVPLVAITGQVRTDLMGTDAFQEADIAGMATAITRRVFVVRELAQLAPILRSAFAIAGGARPGPVLVDVPSDILKAIETPEGAQRARAPRPHRARRVPKADPSAIAAAVERIRQAKNPVAIVGGGARTSNAVASYREFCALLGLPHAATINGLGAPAPGDETFLGMLGMHGWKAANLAVARADVVLGLGMRFDDRVTGPPEKFATQASIVHADIDASEFNKIVPADIALHGDLDETLTELTRALRAAGVPRFDAWASEARGLGSSLPRDRARAGRLSATDVLDALFEMAPPDSVFTTDVGQHQMWAAQRVRPSHPRNFLTSASLGAMGFGFPAAIGACFARPGTPVFAIVGDGGFQMSMAELATVRRYEVPVKIVLIDNRNLGMVRQWQELFYDARYSATNLSDNPEFATIASAYEIAAEVLDDPAHTARVLRRFIDTRGPMLLHCRCYPDENVWPMVPAGAAMDTMMEEARS
ncbi:MAG TPA: biosynthetic-type acetolactate synthase large subunit [Candidatus Baltobacteraceae bacterium]